MAASKRRQDERHLKLLRELGAQPANKRCFDCQQRGPTYVDMTTGAFVCTSCSGILRGLNPPHRVKSISMTSFTPEEIEFIRCKGNEYCRRVWLGTYDPRLMPESESNDEQRIKDFLIQKYERKRWYVDPSIALKNQPSPVPNSTLSPTSDSKSSVLFSTNLVKQVTTIPPSQTANANSSSKSTELGSLSNSSGHKLPARPVLDLLGGFPSDPFAATNTGQSATTNANANFADFDSFNSGAVTPPSVGTTPMSIASSSSSQMSGTLPSPCSAASTLLSSGGLQQASNVATASTQDKYAALADLDNLFNTSNANTTVDWEGKSGSSQWQMNGMSSLSFSSTGNTPTNPCNTTGFASGSGNPFSGNSQQSSWTPTQQQSPSTFCSGNPFAAGGYGSQPTPSSAFSQFGSSPVTPPSSYITYPPANGQMNPLISPPGNVSSWGGANMGHWVNFGSPAQPSSAFPSQTGVYQGNKMMGMPFNSWHQSNVGNPFVGGGAAVHPRSNSSNPFL